MGRPGKKRGYLGRIRSDWGRKQQKTCVWVSAVGGKAFLQRSQIVNGVGKAFGIVGFGFGFIPAVDADDEMAFGDIDACVVLGTHQ